MVKKFCVFLASLLAVCICFASFLVANVSNAYAVSKQASESTLDPELPAWVIKADPYIQISNGKATIDPKAYQVLTTDEMANVQLAVEHYNSFRSTPPRSGSTIQSASDCSNPGSFTNYWWGTRYHMASCAVQLVLIGTSLAALFPGAEVAAVLVDAVLQFQSLRSCDGSVSVDVSWAGPPTIGPGC